LDTKGFRQGNGSKYCWDICIKKKCFSRISDGKIREVVFVGPKIIELIQDVKFEGQLSKVEKAT